MHFFTMNSKYKNLSFSRLDEVEFSFREREDIKELEKREDKLYEKLMKKAHEGYKQDITDYCDILTLLLTEAGSYFYECGLNDAKEERPEPAQYREYSINLPAPSFKHRLSEFLKELFL